MTSPCSAATSCSQILVAWNASADNTGGSGVAGYKIYRNGVQFADTTSTSYYSLGLSAGTNYSFKVAGYDNAGNISAQSTAASATTPTCTDTTPPSVPTGLTAVAASCSQVNLSWNGSTDNAGGSGLAGYRIFRNGAQIAQTTGTSFNVSGLSGSTFHSFTVTAYDYAGYSSAQSTAATVTTPACSSPPAAPSSLTAVAASSSQINLTWVDNANNESGFKIERATASGGPWSQIATLGFNIVSYQSAGLAASTPYYFRVRAYNTGGDSAYSNTASATTSATSTAPSAPSNLTATAVSSSQINLAWLDNSTNETGFKIERATASSGPWSQIATLGVNIVSYQSTGLAASTPYYFRVRAYNTGGDSAFSNTASATTQTSTSVPAAPSNLTAVVASSSQINLAWVDNSTNETGFKIERATASSGPWTQITAVGGNVVSYQNTGLAASTPYYFRVRAYNTAGDSPYSNTASATTSNVANSGALLWSQRFGGTAAESTQAIAISSGDEVFATGYFQGTSTLGGTSLVSAGGTDIFLAKYSSAPSGGAPRWSKRIGGTGNDFGLSLAADPFGDVVVTGYFVGTADFGGQSLTSAGGEDAFVAKYSGANGALQWLRRIGGVGNDRGQSIAADYRGDIAVTGYFTNDTVDFGNGVSVTAYSGPDTFVAKYSGTNGSHAWSRNFPNSSDDFGNAVAVGGSGDVFLAGYFIGGIDLGGGALVSAGANDILLAKLSGATGGHIWSKRFGSTGPDIAKAIAVDASDNVVVTGYFTQTVDFGGGPLNAGTTGYSDLFVAKYSGSNGAEIWSLNSGSTLFADEGKAIAVDPSGNVVVTGSFQGTIDLGGGPLVSAGLAELFVAKFSAARGDHQWSKRFGGVSDEIGFGVAVDGNSYTLATGYFWGSVGFGADTLTSAGSTDVFLVSFAP